eukprot:3074644-Pyramimonas_sp.AAC.2
MFANPRLLQAGCRAVGTYVASLVNEADGDVSPLVTRCLFRSYYVLEERKQVLFDCVPPMLSEALRVGYHAESCRTRARCRRSSCPVAVVSSPWAVAAISRKSPRRRLYLLHVRLAGADHYCRHS